MPKAYVKLNPAMPLFFYYSFSLLILFVFMSLFLLCFFFLSYFNLISLQNEIYQNWKSKLVLVFKAFYNLFQDKSFQNQTDTNIFGNIFLSFIFLYVLRSGNGCLPRYYLFVVPSSGTPWFHTNARTYTPPHHTHTNTHSQQHPFLKKNRNELLPRAIEKKNCTNSSSPTTSTSKNKVTSRSMKRKHKKRSKRLSGIVKNIPQTETT